MADFLNTAFAGFDGAIFQALNSLAVSAGDFFTPFFRVISLLGEKGLLFIITGLVLLLFAKTRKMGFTMLFAIAIGALFTNVILKDLVARPRPFTTAEYEQFWIQAGKIFEDEFSFPSGHTTAIMASMTALFLTANKKWSWVGFIGVILMGLSRIYLVAHYPTDVIAGIIVGGIGAIASYFIVKWAFGFASKRSGKKFFNFVLNFDLIYSIKNKKWLPEQIQNVAEQETEDKE